AAVHDRDLAGPWRAAADGDVAAVLREFPGDPRVHVWRPGN
ncbi:MAG: hypothetical protein JWR62_3059, partial [Modestobacter sp.]|nr:hypothetical protein [Modestobacter sp.]